ncbi:MAG: long-chain fatty acid--CoA ligase, partial [Eubacterium sp.]|nr:long-chain fatty acid--CoA ligase [Candidatus Colimonas fimequi]
PKSVPINDINEVLSAHDAIMHYPLSVNDVDLNMTPLFHRGGTHSGGPCPTFYIGATLVLMRAFAAKTTLSYVEEYGVTYLTGSPAALEMIARIQAKTPFDLSSLKGVVTMGAPLEKAACERFMEILTPNIFNGYGTTETFWNSFLRPYDLPEAAGGVGGSCTDDEVRVVRVYEDRKAEPDEVVPMDGETVGEVIICSPGKGTYTYYKNEEEATKKYYKGWMYTADLGVWDEKTYVTITGRKDDMIVCSGENIYPTQIEEAINTFDKVKDSMVTAVPDKVRGQAVAAYVVPEDDSLTIGELVEFCRQSPMLSTYKRPRYYKIVDSLPHTATGKKMHYVLKQQAAEDLAKGELKRK